MTTTHYNLTMCTAHVCNNTLSATWACHSTDRFILLFYINKHYTKINHHKITDVDGNKSAAVAGYQLHSAALSPN